VLSRGAEDAPEAARKSSIFQEQDVRNINGNAVPFNSRIERGDCERLGQKFNPAPGEYFHLKKSSAFKYDFITKENI